MTQELDPNQAKVVSLASPCEGAVFVILLIMAWSPVVQRRVIEVGHLGDYAAFNSNQPRDETWSRSACTLNASARPRGLTVLILSLWCC
jgi:hypothetical protein